MVSTGNRTSGLLGGLDYGGWYLHIMLSAVDVDSDSTDIEEIPHAA